MVKDDDIPRCVFSSPVPLNPCAKLPVRDELESKFQYRQG